MSITGEMLLEVCDHCDNSSCPNCDEKYYGGVENSSCCSGYHY